MRAGRTGQDQVTAKRLRLKQALLNTVQSVRNGSSGGGGGGSTGRSWAALSGPPGLHHEGSMPGFSVWSLIAHAQRDRLLRRAFRQRRAAKQASNAAFVSRRSGEQRRSVGAACRSAAATNTARRESRAGAKRFHSLNSHPTEGRGGGSADGGSMCATQKLGETQMEVFCELVQPL